MDLDWAWILISDLYRGFRHPDDTTVDRLNRLYTVAILTGLIPLVSTQNYVIGSRISCWTPTDFSGSQIIYTKDICWIGQNSYFVPESNLTLLDRTNKREYRFVLYPWLPLILLMMLLTFILPYKILWHNVDCFSGIQLRKLISMKKTEHIAHTISLHLSKNLSGKASSFPALTAIYILMKTIYIIVILCQIVLVNKILFGEYFRFDFVSIFRFLSTESNLTSSVRNLLRSVYSNSHFRSFF